MANPDEGELEFKAKGKTYVLSFSNRTLRSLEKALKKPVGKILSDMQEKQSFDELVTIFWYGLKARYPDISEDEASDLVTPGQLTKLIGEAFALAFKSIDEDERPAERPQLPIQ